MTWQLSRRPSTAATQAALGRLASILAWRPAGCGVRSRQPPSRAQSQTVSGRCSWVIRQISRRLKPLPISWDVSADRPRPTGYRACQLLQQHQALGTRLNGCSSSFKKITLLEWGVGQASQIVGVLFRMGSGANSQTGIATPGQCTQLLQKMKNFIFLPANPRLSLGARNRRYTLWHRLGQFNTGGQRWA